MFAAFEARMWALVKRHTGRVGYRRGVKAEGLECDSPVIDCSGWVGLLLGEAMRAENEASERCVFVADHMQAVQTWSDRIIEEIAKRTGFILEVPELTIDILPRCATIGLKMGNPSWANNHPRSRGITHVVQVVRRPDDGAAFVSEAFGGTQLNGVCLTPLAGWFVEAESYQCAGEVWVVDALRLAR
jgi:hypothetical protein